MSSDLVALISAIARQTYQSMHVEGQSIGLDGSVARGSWNPTDGTVSVEVLNTSALIGDTPEQSLLMQRVPLLVTSTRHQSPPVGGERVLLIPSHSGWGAILQHGADDSLKAPAGENWQTHSTGSSVKLTNNGGVSISANANISVTGNNIRVQSTGATFGGGTTYALVPLPVLQTLVTYIASHTHSSSGSGPPSSPPPTPTGTGFFTAN